MRRTCLSILAAVLLPSAISFAAIPNNVTLRDFFGLTFNRPVFLAEVPGKDSNFVVLEQLSGTVLLVRRVNGTWTKSTLTTVTAATNQNQMGLLGFAFHPQYRTNRKYYLSYNPSTSSQIIVERVTDTSLIADGGTAARTILTVAKPGTNQNGGSIAFGPDGYLYIGLGDGGGNGDPSGHAQNHNDLLGKMLRIDVNGTAAGTYSIPADNPFVGQTGWREEIWALGLRNPWKFAFHPVRQELWLGDVGQGTPNTIGYEEIDFVPKGGNMGWNILESTHCYPPPSTGSCNTTGFTAPALELARTLSVATVGGVFFYGNPSGGFHDTYFFGDNGSGRLWAGRTTAAGAVTEYAQVATLANVSSFALDSRGRVFAVKLGNTNGQNITANSGSVMILESPDIIPQATTALWPSFHKAAMAVPRAELIRSGKYSLRSLSGRDFKPGDRGIFLVSERNGNAAPFLQVLE